MKKNITAVLCALLVSVHCFAEFVITPTVGFSDFVLTGKEFDSSAGNARNAKTSLTAFALSVDLGIIAEKGFTFLWDNNLSFGGNLKSKVGDSSEVVSKVSGALYEGNFLFGYTYKGIKNLYINAAAGFGSGIGVMQADDGSRTGIVTTGIPIHLGAQYFFTKNIGLNFSLMDIPSFGSTMTPLDFGRLFKEISTSLFDSKVSEYGSAYGYSGSGTSSSADRIKFQTGFTNVFILKIGPVFKF